MSAQKGAALSAHWANNASGSRSSKHRAALDHTRSVIACTITQHYGIYHSGTLSFFSVATPAVMSPQENKDGEGDFKLLCLFCRLIYLVLLCCLCVLAIETPSLPHEIPLTHFLSIRSLKARSRSGWETRAWSRLSGPRRRRCRRPPSLSARSGQGIGYVCSTMNCPCAEEQPLLLNSRTKKIATTNRFFPVGENQSLSHLTNSEFQAMDISLS